MPNWLSKEGVGYLYVTIKARVQVISLAMADKVEFCMTVPVHVACQSVGAAGFLDPFWGEAPIPAPAPELHGCHLLPFVMWF